MEHRKVKYFIFGITIVLVVLAILNTVVRPRNVETKAKHDIGNAMETTVALIKPELISDSVGPISVACYGVMFGETVCKSTLYLGSPDFIDPQKEQEEVVGVQVARTRQGITLRDIENYILEASATLEKHGWLRTGGSDLKREGVTELHLLYSKRFGSADCEVLLSYTSIRRVSGSLDFDYHIICEKTFADLI